VWRWHEDDLPRQLAIRTYHERPAQVLMADRFAHACLATVTDPALRDLPLVGAVDSVDLLSEPQRWRRLAAPYAAWMDDSTRPITGHPGAVAAAGELRSCREAGLGGRGGPARHSSPCRACGRTSGL
jgi:hypothetical protein